jgi:hypothetical protein
MKTIRLYALAALAVLSLTGCDLAKLRNPEADAQARALYDHVRHGDPAGAASRLDPKIRTLETAAGITQLSHMIPAGEPLARRAVGITTQQGAETTTVLTDEYDYPQGTVLATTTFVRRADKDPWLAQGLHLNFVTKKELTANAFLQPRPWPQYLFFALLLASVATMVAAFVKVVRTRDLKRKWLWCVLSLLGVATFQMNWTTGQFIVNPITVNLIGAGIVRSLSVFSPWMLNWTFPLGAILILTGLWANPARGAARKTERMATAKNENAEPPKPDDASGL